MFFFIMLLLMLTARIFAETIEIANTGKPIEINAEQKVHVLVPVPAQPMQVAAYADVRPALPKKFDGILLDDAALWTDMFASRTNKLLGVTVLCGAGYAARVSYWRYVFNPSLRWGHWHNEIPYETLVAIPRHAVIHMLCLDAGMWQQTVPAFEQLLAEISNEIELIAKACDAYLALSQWHVSWCYATQDQYEQWLETHERLLYLRAIVSEYGASLTTAGAAKHE